MAFRIVRSPRDLQDNTAIPCKTGTDASRTSQPGFKAMYLFATGFL
ncbi:MAG: hypothetical protein MH252_00820 [Thermosynechococcaceae cyanobacterium MS004]|nr:hypothetical protein [Thermosynechococcaceae cyanobacterium MS004]